MLISATPTDHFIAVCAACIRPTRITDPAAQGDRLTTTCAQCEAALIAERLYGTKTAIGCDARCMGATGKICECSCRGENHGKSFGTIVSGEMLAGALQRYRDQVAAREAAKIKRQDAKRQAERDQFNAWADDHRDVVGFLGTGDQFDRYGRDGFLADMADIVNRPQQLTERQAAAVRRCITARKRFERVKAEREANAKPCPTGKAITITGEIVKAWVEDGFRGQGIRQIMTVRSDGYEVRMTIPRSLTPVITPDYLTKLVGRTVTVVADIEHSRNSNSYGFGKRPRQAQLV